MIPMNCCLLPALLLATVLTVQTPNSVKIELTSGLHFSPVSDRYTYESTMVLLYNISWEIVPPELHLPKLVKPTLDSIMSPANEIARGAVGNDTERVRQKRGIQIIGDILNYCCNVVTEKSLDGLVRHDEELNAYLNSVRASVSANHEDVVHLSQSMTNFSVTTNRAISDLSAQIKEYAGYFTENLQYMFRLITQLGDLGEDTLHIAQFTSHVLQKQIAMVLCRMNMFPTTVISPEVVTADLRNLEEIAAKYGYFLSIPVSENSTYFRLNNVKCLFNEKTLVVEMKVPIEKDHWELHTVQALPFVSEGKLCNVDHEVMLIARNGGDIRLIAGSDLRACDIDHGLTCKVPEFPDEYQTAQQCVQQAFVGASIDELKQVCLFTCKPKSKASLVRKLGRHEFSLTNIGDTFMVECEDGYSANHSVPVEYGSTLMTLPCGCSIVLENGRVLTPSFPCEPDSTKYRIVHALPAQWSHASGIDIPDFYNQFRVVYNNMTKIVNPNWSVTLAHNDFALKSNYSDPGFADIKFNLHTSATGGISILVVVLGVAVAGLWMKVRQLEQQLHQVGVTNINIGQPHQAHLTVADIGPPLPARAARENAS